jgi:hypothetical protein
VTACDIVKDVINVLQVKRASVEAIFGKVFAEASGMSLSIYNLISILCNKCELYRYLQFSGY